MIVSEFCSNKFLRSLFCTTLLSVALCMEQTALGSCPNGQEEVGQNYDGSSICAAVPPATAAAPQAVAAPPRSTPSRRSTSARTQTARPPRPQVTPRGWPQNATTDWFCVDNRASCQSLGGTMGRNRSNFCRPSCTGDFCLSGFSASNRTSCRLAGHNVQPTPPTPAVPPQRAQRLEGSHCYAHTDPSTHPRETSNCALICMTSNPTAREAFACGANQTPFLCVPNGPNPSCPTNQPGWEGPENQSMIRRFSSNSAPGASDSYSAMNTFLNSPEPAAARVQPQLLLRSGTLAGDTCAVSATANSGPNCAPLLHACEGLFVNNQPIYSSDAATCAAGGPFYSGSDCTDSILSPRVSCARLELVENQSGSTSVPLTRSILDQVTSTGALSDGRLVSLTGSNFLTAAQTPNGIATLTTQPITTRPAPPPSVQSRQTTGEGTACTPAHEPASSTDSQPACQLSEQNIAQIRRQYARFHPHIGPEISQSRVAINSIYRPYYAYLDQSGQAQLREIESLNRQSCAAPPAGQSSSPHFQETCLGAQKERIQNIAKSIANAEGAAIAQVCDTSTSVFSDHSLSTVIQNNPTLSFQEVLEDPQNNFCSGNSRYTSDQCHCMRMVDTETSSSSNRFRDGHALEDMRDRFGRSLGRRLRHGEAENHFRALVAYRALRRTAEREARIRDLWIYKGQATAALAAEPVDTDGLRAAILNASNLALPIEYISMGSGFYEVQSIIFDHCPTLSAVELALSTPASTERCPETAEQATPPPTASVQEPETPTPDTAAPATTPQ